MTHRLALPNRRNHVTQKIKIAGQRTLYVSLHDDKRPAEILLRVEALDCSSELLGYYDVIARLMNLALQSGLTRSVIASLEPNVPHAAGLWRLGAGGREPERTR